MIQSLVQQSSVEDQPRERLRSAIVWSYALTAGRLGTTTVVTLLLAKLLGPHAFGVVAQALVFVMFAQTLLQQTLLTTIIQREDLDGEHLDAGFWMVLAGSVVLAALSAGAAPLWAAFNGVPELTRVCVALTPMIILQGLTVVPEALLRRSMTFRSLALRTLAAAVAGGLVGIGCALAGLEAWALVAQQLVTGIMGAAVLWAVTGWRPRLRSPAWAVRDLWSFSARSAAGGIGVFLALRLDVLVLGKYFGPVAVGLYRIAGRLPDMLVEVTVRSLQQVSLPELARLQRERDALADRLATMLHAAAVVGLPALGVLAAVAVPLVALLGPEWSAAGPAMRLLCVVGAINVYGLMLGPTLQAVDRPGLNSAFAWAQLAVGLAAFALVGQSIRASVEDRTQVTAIAATMVGIELAITVVMAHVTFHRVLRVPVRRVVLATVPALAAGSLAVASTWLVERLVDGSWLLKFFAHGLVASGIAAAVLLAFDGRLRRMLVWRLERARGVSAASPAAASEDRLHRG